jgi:2'-5' RNA ligase
MTGVGPDDKLILSLWMDEAAQARFDRLRALHFPAGRTAIGAHVTLFHALPGAGIDAIAAMLATEAAALAPCPVAVSGLRFLGYGVAYTLACPPVSALRARVAATLDGSLTAQDRQPWRPHVTIQNKAPAAEARRLHEAMQAAFVPFGFTARGLALWRYAGGPWEPLGRFAFAAPGSGRMDA